MPAPNSEVLAIHPGCEASCDPDSDRVCSRSANTRVAASRGIEGQGLIPKPRRPSVRAPSSASPGRCAAFSVRCAVSAALPGVSPSSRRLLPGFAIRRALRGCEMQQTCRTARPKLRLKPVLHISQVHAPRSFFSHFGYADVCQPRSLYILQFYGPSKKRLMGEWIPIVVPVLYNPPIIMPKPHFPIPTPKNQGEETFGAGWLLPGLDLTRSQGLGHLCPRLLLRRVTEP